jgi:hypothetical protein
VTIVGLVALPLPPASTPAAAAEFATLISLLHPIYLSQL